MEMKFVRHEPYHDRILFVLTLDRKKMRERILIGDESQIRLCPAGIEETDVHFDETHPLGNNLRSGTDVCRYPDLERIFKGKAAQRSERRQ